MNNLSYDVNSYITMLQMSSKQRVLVEGRSDRIHLKNLLSHFKMSRKTQIDTAQDIRGNSDKNKKCNRQKIEDIHALCHEIKSTYFLCDREFREFNITDKIDDNLKTHFQRNQLFWTLGHSLENYFFEIDILSDAYSYLSFSEYKSEAISKFEQILPSAFLIIAAISLSAMECKSASYPMGIIKWNNFILKENTVSLDEKIIYDNDINRSFISSLNKFLPIMIKSNPIDCSRLCRGHTGIIMLQRLFSACLYETAREHNEDIALEYATRFNNLSEENVSCALSESWSRQVKAQQAQYPEPLINRLIS
ncbi:DUF4435 domain-containing protein [Pragia fontium]|uniref:DUF4435 domain-containing protein n=1 Tax=Pragia fontium TaxID=82985 RepID=UPI000F6B8F5B|nr:DUF4435 domain-containing protein [Pragia fontium]VEJ54964.1 Uncharacterised protein [Pragia fontium]